MWQRIGDWFNIRLFLGQQFYIYRFKRPGSVCRNQATPSLEPILSTNMTNIYTSPCDYLHLSEIRKKLTGVITTESTLKLYSV